MRNKTVPGQGLRRKNDIQMMCVITLFAEQGVLFFFGEKEEEDFWLERK